ncbi:hypothetical protein SAMN05660242_1246 [Thermoanaerobacterium sp. RBIITD]|nr:hypothetical protein SAMN05660242_1246 [Thermoanaerobacterium sp. RBIITD]
MQAINFFGKNNWLFAVLIFIINLIFYKALPQTVAIQWRLVEKFQMQYPNYYLFL